MSPTCWCSIPCIVISHTSVSLCEQAHTAEMLSRLGNKRHICYSLGLSPTLFLLAHLLWEKLAVMFWALQRGPGDEELQLPANSQWRTEVCSQQPCEWAFLEADPHAPTKPSCDAALAGSWTAGSWETLVQATLWSHAQIPDTQKLWDNTFLLF